MNIINTIFTIDSLNITLITINIISCLYLKYFVCRAKKKDNINLLDSRTKIVLDGILIIESFFFAAVYVWIGTGRSNSFGGATDPSLMLYTFAEWIKGIYFMSIIFLVIKDVRFAAKNIDYNKD